MTQTNTHPTTQPTTQPTVYWEEFTGGPFRRSGSQPYVSLSGKRVFSFNRLAHALIGRAEAVRLFFDRKNGMIGILPVDPATPDAFPVKAKKGTGATTTWVIYASTFCRHFKITVRDTEVFPDPTVDDQGYLRLDLKTSYNTNRPKRGKGENSRW